DLGRLGGDMSGHLEIVLGKVESHSQQGLSPCVAIGGIQVQMILTLTHRTAMNAEPHRVVVVPDHRLLPRLAPGGRSRRNRLVFNRTPVAVDGPDIGSADESEA